MLLSALESSESQRWRQLQQLKQTSTIESCAVRTGNYGVSSVMTGEIGDDFAVIPIAMVDTAVTDLFALPMDMDIEMESGITVLLASMCKSGSDQKNTVQENV